MCRRCILLDFGTQAVELNVNDVWWDVIASRAMTGGGDLTQEVLRIATRTPFKKIVPFWNKFDQL